MSASWKSTFAAVAALAAAGVLLPRATDQAVALGLEPEALARLAAPWRTGPNAEDRARATRGYYQGLLDDGEAAVRRGLLALHLDAPAERRRFERITHARRRDDFLFYDVPPSLDVVGPTGRVRSNAHGLCDDEYERAKPPGTRRAALLGSSIARGAGVEPGLAYETLLERRLDEEYRRPGGGRVEILNFAVDGWRLTQMLACALDRCPDFEPDLYLVEISPLVSPQAWADHLVALVHAGIDLRFPLLREVAREADVSRYDPPATTAAKLAPYRLRVLRFALETLREHARSSGADLLVLLVPLADEPDEIRRDFEGIDALCAELGLATLDVRDAFDGVADLAAVQNGPQDHHPSAAGHRRIAERIEAALASDPDLLALFTGR